MKARRRLCGSHWAVPTAQQVASGTRIGIPRALTTHSLFPLYSTFFSQYRHGSRALGCGPAGGSEFAFGVLLPRADCARSGLGPSQERRGPDLHPACRAHAPSEPVQRFVPLSDHTGRTLFPGQGVSRSPLTLARAGVHQRLRDLLRPGRHGGGGTGNRARVGRQRMGGRCAGPDRRRAQAP